MNNPQKRKRAVFHVQDPLQDNELSTAQQVWSRSNEVWKLICHLNIPSYRDSQVPDYNSHGLPSNKSRARPNQIWWRPHLQSWRLIHNLHFIWSTPAVIQILLYIMRPHDHICRIIAYHVCSHFFTLDATFINVLH